MKKLDEVRDFILARLGEASTWQAIGFMVGLFTSKYNGVDWGQAAAVGGLMSAFIKMFTKG